MDKKRKKKQIANATLAIPIALSVLTQGLPFEENEFLHKKAEASSVFSGGDGTVNNPYIITNALQFHQIRNFPDAYFKLANDIDLSVAGNWQPIANFSGTLDGNGKTITGLYIDGISGGGLFGNTIGATIKNLTIKDPQITTTGGSTGALIGTADIKTLSNYTPQGTTIENVSIEGGYVKNTQGGGEIGGLIGYSKGSEIRNVFVNTVVDGLGKVGGVIGRTYRAEYNVYVGYTGYTRFKDGNMENILVAGEVRGAGGGIIGEAYNVNVKNAIAVNSVIGDSTGGLIGNSNQSSFQNLYALNKEVKPKTPTNTFVSKTILQGSGTNIVQLDTIEGVGRTQGATNLISNEEIFLPSSYKDFDFVNDWKMDEVSGLPVLRFKEIHLEKPVLNTVKTAVMHNGQVYGAIRNAADLDAVRYSPMTNYILTQDIDLSGINWNPISDFQGVLDGDGHTIRGLTINQPTLDYVGLFAKLTGATISNLLFKDVNINGRNKVGVVTGTTALKNANTNSPILTLIKNVGVESGTVQGTSYVGGLVGELAAANISQSFSNANIKGNGNLGGLVGATNSLWYSYYVNLNYYSYEKYSSIDNSFSTGNVEGTSSNVGGIAGDNYKSTISYVYATGSVSGYGNIGGIVGNARGSVNNVYALNKSVTGTNTSTVGKIVGSGTATQGSAISTMSGTGNSNGVLKTITPSQAMSQMTYEFSNWDFGSISGTPIWGIDEGNTLPYLVNIPRKVVFDSSLGTWIPEVSEPTLNFTLNVMVNGNVAEVTWTPIDNAEGYKVVFKNSSGQDVYTQEVDSNTTSLTHTLQTADSYTVEVIPKLNGIYSTGVTENFTISNTNNAPTSTTIPNQTLKVTDSPKTIDVKNYFSDSDGDPLSFTVSSNNGNVTVSNNGSQVTITPKAVGTSTITVTANDGKGGTVQQTFTVTVQEVAPAAVQNLQVVANSYNQVTVTFSPVANADEYIIKRNGQEVARITGTSYVDNSVAAETTYNYEVIAVNEAGQSTPASMSVVTPKKPNTNPTASTIPNQTLKVTDAPKTMDVKSYFSDADGDPLSFTVSSNNGNVTVSNNGSQVTITPKAVGTSTITVTANDGKGGTVQQTFTVTVQEVAPAAVQNLQVVANSYNQVTVTFSPVANADEYIIKRNGQEVARITGTSYTDNNVAAETTYNYEVIAANEAGQSAPASMSVVTPKKPNNAPTASAIPNQTLKVTDSPKTIDLKNYFSDADGDTLTFSVQANNGNVTVSNSGSQVTITPKAVGTSTITVTADDGKGGTVQQTFTVTVQEVAPDTVQNIQVSLNGTKATVTWDAFPNATGYRVQRYVKNSEGQFVKDGFARSVTSTTYEDTTLVAGKEYQYEITPRTNVYLTGSAGLSAPFVVPSATPEEPPAGGGDNGTAAPSVQVQVNGSTVTVTWPAMDGVTRYRVERFKKDANGQYARDGVAKSVSETTVTETLPNGEYKYVITPRVGYVYDTTKAMEGFGTVGSTSTGGGSTTSPAATFVPNVHAIVQGTKVTLQWDPFMVGQQAADYYRVIRYVKDEQGQFVQDGTIRTINGTSLVDTVAANKEYRYEVIPRGSTTYLFDKSTKVSLTALAEGERKVFVADNVLSDGRTQYEVQRYVKDTTTGQYVADGQPFTVNQLSFVDPNPIDANKEYKYTFK